MKRLITTAVCASIAWIGYAQMGYYDYKDKMPIEIEGTTYKIDNYLEKCMDQAYKGVSIGMEDVNNHRFVEFGLYKDGTYAEDIDEVGGIILVRSAYRRIIYDAVRKVFPKSELEAHPDDKITVFAVIDDQGNILETASYFRIRKDYVIQPEQIASIERDLRANLKFELNREKADKFCYFEGQISIPFAYFAEDMPTLQPANPIGNTINGNSVGIAIGNKIPIK